MSESVTLNGEEGDEWLEQGSEEERSRKRQGEAKNHQDVWEQREIVEIFTAPNVDLWTYFTHPPIILAYRCS